jgi:IS30 family transposase
MIDFSLGNVLADWSINMTDFKKHKHLTYEDRDFIQDGLDHGLTFKAIAKEIKKDPTTVSKEVKKHLITKNSDVKRTDLNGKTLTHPCLKLIKAPFVCNSCDKRKSYCSFPKQFYYAKHAHRQYTALLSESREGIPLNKETFYQIDKIISDGIKKGQHLYHIMNSNDIPVSKSTIYRHLKLGYLSVASIDFPRVVKFKARKKKYLESIPKALKVGRSFDDFNTFIEENNVSSWVEMDTVIGRIGGKTILTLVFTFCNFMVGLLLDDKSSAEVTDKISKLKSSFTDNHISFGDIFPIILTDNGGEFANVFGIECALTGERETSLFFCDPNSSYQKAKVEKNHTLFRDIVPKGSTFDNFKQNTVNTIFSHVNSIKRKRLNGKTPYEIFSFVFGSHVAKLLGVEPIPPDKVIQSPALLK